MQAPLPPLTEQQRQDLATVTPSLQAKIERSMRKKNQQEQQRPTPKPPTKPVYDAYSPHPDNIEIPPKDMAYSDWKELKLRERKEAQANAFFKKVDQDRHPNLAMLGTDSKQPLCRWFFLFPWRRQIWETIRSAAITSYLAPVLKRRAWRMVNGVLFFFLALALVGIGFLRFVGGSFQNWNLKKEEKKD